MNSLKTFNLNKQIAALLLATLSMALVSCGDADQGTADSANNQTLESTEQISVAVDMLSEEQANAVREIIQLYLQELQADFADAGQHLQTFDTQIDDFLASTDETSLATARDGWQLAYNAYETTQLHRYFAAEVFSDDLLLQLGDLDYRLNQWPILPGYVDAVDNYPDSGLVFDTSVALVPDTLREIHGQFDLAEAALGFHVIEFLLWGENLTAGGPRPASDFVAATSLNAEQIEFGFTLEQLPNNRRRELLDLLAELINTDYQNAARLWSQGMGEYALSVDTLVAEDLLSDLLQAINAMLTEELLVRSLYPLLNGEYEESLHSRFSNSTEDSVIAQLATLERLLMDTSSTEGMRLDSLFADLSDDFAELFYQNFDASKECLVLLYSDVAAPESPEEMMAAEFEVVECINLLTNMIDHFNRLQQSLGRA